MSRPSPRRGFTILELVVVLSIVAVLAYMALAATSAISRRGGLSMAHHTIKQAFEQAKAYSFGHATDVVVVIVGNDTPVNANKCGVGVLQLDTDARCVRYFILEDKFTVAGTHFDAAALQNFDPQAPQSLGDKLIASGALGRGVMIGTAPGYTPVQPVANSIFEGMNLVAADLPCSFCQAGAPPKRGFVRFGADGQVKLGNDGTFPKSLVGGFIAFTGVAPDGTPIPTTNWLAISVPAGLVTERLSQTGR